MASSGNSGGATPLYPANYPEVIAVGATVYDKSLASYSNRGNELCAPGGTSDGEEVLVQIDASDYNDYPGTLQVYR